jgi:outer membrane protein assembly factor BamB
MTEFPIERRNLLRATGAGLLGTTGVGAAQTTGTQETSGGDLIWEFTQPSDGVHSSPTIVDGTVYVGSNDSNLYAVDAATGSQEWTFDTSGYVRSSPTVADGTVYVGSYDDTLYAVDAATGSQEWVFETSDYVFSSPTIVDGTVYVGSDDKTLYAVDAATGSQEWAFTQPSGGVSSSPTIVDGTVYVGSDDTLYAVDAANATVRLSTTVTATGTSENYTRRVAVGPDGRYTVAVANPGEYTVRTTDGSETVTVGEPAVLGGGNVTAPPLPGSGGQ